MSRLRFPAVQGLAAEKDDGVRVTAVLKRLLGLCRVVVVCSWEVVEPGEDDRPKLVARVRTKAGRRGY